MIICRTYFTNTIPDELYEAGQIDGCTPFGFLLRIVLPLSKPILAVLILYYGVSRWNSYYDAMIYLNSPSLMPESALYREFRQIFSVSFSEYLENLRIEKACELLRSQPLVKDVSARVGYNSDYSFRRAFKRVLGVTPSAYMVTAKRKRSPYCRTRRSLSLTGCPRHVSAPVSIRFGISGSMKPQECCS